MSGTPFNADELATIFGFRNKRGVNRAIRNGIFPIPTYMHDGRRFAHADHVNAFLAQKKLDAEREFQERQDEDYWDE